MNHKIVTTSQLQKIDFTSEKLPEKSFENMEFDGCTFKLLSNIDFTDCVFKNCNLSNVKFSNCKLHNVAFENCKLLGVDFSTTKEFGFGIYLSACNLDYSSFDKKKMNLSAFANCSLKAANFTQADLSKTTFSNCNFQDAVFLNTNLSGVDLRSAQNFNIDPEQNRLRKARFMSQDLVGLLLKYDLIIE